MFSRPAGFIGEADSADPQSIGGVVHPAGWLPPVDVGRLASSFECRRPFKTAPEVDSFHHVRLRQCTLCDRPAARYGSGETPPSRKAA